MTMNSRNRRTVDQAAIEHNMREICSSLPEGVRAMAVVKADGYGHGACTAAEAALRGGASMLAVATAEEGAELREKGIRAPILVLGAVTACDAGTGVDHGLIQTVCSPEMVRLCGKAAQERGRTAEVHLKIDTGMGRIGVRTEEERNAVLKAMEACPCLKLTGAYTHFADADGGAAGDEYTRQQYLRFLAMTEGLPQNVIRHCCNSAGIHRHPEMYLDMVRAGISLYGYPPVETEMKLEPCMTWTACISYIKEIPAGTFVSYGRTWQAERTVRAATITCGYGDGYHRSASGNAYVLIRGKRARIIGRICMDQMMADVTGIPEAEAGDEVVLMGKSGTERISAEDIAKWSGTISYEVLLSAGSRVKRETIRQDGEKGTETDEPA